MANSIGMPFGLVLAKKFYEGQNKILVIEKQQKENELKLLRSQIDPHFLFNNLNTLDSLIDSDAEKAKEYINRLSLIYRYLIKTKDAEVMELSEEIELAENYIFLIKTRFENDYDFKIDCDDTECTNNSACIGEAGYCSLISLTSRYPSKFEREPVAVSVTALQGDS